MSQNRTDIGEGQRFGALVVIDVIDKEDALAAGVELYGGAWVRVRCACGCRLRVRATDLRSGARKFCGWWCPAKKARRVYSMERVA